MQTCANCGYDTADLIAVRRVYVTPESWDTPGSRRVVDDVEGWCPSCASQYPHELAPDADPQGD